MLNNTQVKMSKDKTYLLRDDGGLYLTVDTPGRKYWILRLGEGGKSG